MANQKSAKLPQTEGKMIWSFILPNLSETHFLPKLQATPTDLFTDLNFGSKWASLRFDTRNCLYQDV